MDTQDIAGQDKVPEAHDPKEFVTGIKVEKSISINRPVNEVYSFWRDFENLPKIMSHIKKVDVMDSRHSHWTMHAPARTTVEWDAEIIDERERS